MLKKELITECKKKLLSKKQDLLEILSNLKTELLSRDNGGDEIDQSLGISAENRSLSIQNKYRATLVEIEAALGRIEQGAFGSCDETNDPIEEERLLIIPWTRLSIEGAEIRESFLKRYRSL